MRFLTSTFGYLLRLVTVGLIFRGLVALYLNIWDISSPASISDTFGAYLYGWHFDLAIGSVIYLLMYWLILLFDLGPKATKRWNFLFLWVYIVFIVTDALYAKESGRHISYEVYSLFTVEGSLLKMLARYWLPLLISLLSASFLNLWLAPTYRFSSGLFGRLVAGLLTAAIAVVGFRGFEGIPQDVSWAYRAGSGPQGAVLAMNGAYGILWAALAGKTSSKEDIHTPNEVATAKIFNDWKSRRGIKAPIGKFDGNMVIVFLEGWPATDIHRVHEGTEVIPFFNKLQKESLHTDLFLAGGHRTSEGLFATLCSLPNPLGKSIMYSEIENKNFTCLPRLLGDKGYSSAFFQGSDQFTSGVGLLVLKTGFQSSYGKREIPNVESLEQNAWGVYDTDLYDFALSKMQDLQEPMLIGLNTNTTHDNLPSKKADRTKFKSVRQWADHELQQFYEKLKKRPWKKDWVLVLVADHTTYGAASIFDHYAIPFLMKYHSVDGGKSGATPVTHVLIPGVYSQADIAATLADLSGTPAPEFLGRSLLRPQDFSSGASVYHLGQSAWFDGDWSVVFNIRSPGEKKCFKWKEDRSFTHATPCPEQGQNMYEEGLSYIKESQELIFR